ncbi:MAG: class I SAM-dependent methyltransferase [Verrucomicrobia bacterium]|nr:class I SAM-dependent methyltransferase [Verrucomicrobiota bacterium]
MDREHEMPQPPRRPAGEVTTEHPARAAHGSLYDFAPMARTYDRWYKTPAGRAHDRQQKALVRLFLPPIERGSRLLDVGCGTGHWSRFLARLGFLVVGIDISPALIETARSSTCNRCRFLVANAHELPFADKAFDVAAAMAVLEFVSEPELAVAEMVRCTRTPGRLVIGVLNKESPLNRDRIAERKEPYCSGRMFTVSQLGRLLSRFGNVRMGVTPEHVESSRPSSVSTWLEPDSPDTVGKGAFIVAEVCV